MNETYTIRSAVLDDLALLPDIEQEGASRFEPYGLLDVMRSVVSSETDFRVACDARRLWVSADAQNTPIGFALASIVGGNAHLDELDVLSGHGRKGLGTALVQAVHQWAVHKGFSAITLTTLATIPWNRPFYERLGYRVVPASEMPEALRTLMTEERERGLPRENRVAMCCRLSPPTQE